MPASKASVRYKVCAPIHAVKLQEHHGSSLRDPTETLIKIPVDAVIELEGRRSSSGLINVLWDGDPYSVFFEDLEEKAQVLTVAVP